MTKPATRDKILQAALEVFAEKGYHRALVDDIVRASRTSKGAVYHHFPNKEALFLALVDEFSARLAEAVAAGIAGAHGALGKAEASIPPLDTRVATLAWLGAVNEVVIQWLYSGRPDLMTEAVPALTPLLLRSIGAAQ